MGAGIGGGQSSDGGNINISGGEITALGNYGSAGIGGGWRNSSGGSGGTIDISGGIIESTGNANGAGIGGGRYGTGGNINISGGEITATGGSNAAGIGGGYGGDGGEIKISGGTITALSTSTGAGIGGGTNGTGDQITISGGIIESATGGSNAAGIGGGQSGNGGEIAISGGIIEYAKGSGYSAGIGGGRQGNSGTITISGGTIESAQGSDGGAGIGDSGSVSDSGTIKITGGSINATTTLTPLPKAADGSTSLYLNTLTVPEEFEDSFVTKYYASDYGIDDVYTDATRKLYFYLPITAGEELLAVSFDEIDNSEEYYGVTYARTDDTGNNTKTLECIKLPTPLANIDYENEKLIDLISDTNYDISVQLAPQSLSLLSLEPYSHAQQNGNTQSDIDGETRIDESWMGNSIDIVQTRIAIPIGDSDPQNLEISPRPEATPELKALVSSTPESEGDKGKVSGLKVGMAYSTNPNAAPESWIIIDSEDDLELAPGTYYFREIATSDTFATEAVEVVIPAFQAPVAPDSPLDLAGTGLNLDLAYLLMVLLLAFVIPVPKK